MTDEEVANAKRIANVLWEDEVTLGVVAEAANCIISLIAAETLLAEVLATQHCTYYGVDGKYGPVYSGPMVDAAFARVATAEARAADLTAKLKWAHDNLWEINPNNYDHADVRKLNDASVNVILEIAPMIGETHGQNPEWWAARAALKAGGAA